MIKGLPLQIGPIGQTPRSSPHQKIPSALLASPGQAQGSVQEDRLCARPESQLRQEGV